MTSEFKPTIAKGKLESTFRMICSIGPRWQGSEGEKKILAFLEDFIIADLSVDLVKEKFPYLGYRVEMADLEIMDQTQRKVECQGLAYSASDTVEEEVVYVPEKDLEQTDFAGRIVLTDAVRSYLAYPKVLEGEGVGLILGNNLPANLVRVGITSYSGQIGVLPAVAIGSDDTKKLRERVGKGLHMRMKVKAEASEKQGINLIVQEEGSPGDGKILVCSHYDSMWLGPHANDNASGVATLLELIRCFKNSPYNLEFLLCGAEELGFWGSKSYVQQHFEECGQLLAVACTDGITSDLGPVEIGLSEDLAPAIRRLAKERRFGVDRWSIPPRPSSDHASFVSFKKPTFWLTTNAPYYHTAADVPEYVSTDKLARDAQFTAEAIMKLATLDT